MFVTIDGEVFRVVQETSEGGYLVSCEQPEGVRFVAADSLQTTLRVEAPTVCMECDRMMKAPTDAVKARMYLIKPLIEEAACVSDKARCRRLAQKIARENQTTSRRVLRLYYRYLALGAPMVPKIQKKAQVQATYIKAIKRFHFSAKKPTLKETYVFMLSAYYTDADGQLRPGYPSWDSFRMFYYRKQFNKRPQAEIARNGLTNYQRNLRPLHGAQSVWQEAVGVFQMDATIADIYLVEEYDRKEVMGRPNVYLAVDTASQLIAGVYVGMEQGEQSVLSCLVNAARDKVSFCREYGINISPEQWPNMGLPKRILIDRGWEFSGGRMDELCIRFGMEVERLPPFRPDCKGMVEKSFDLLQSQYKSILRGKGVIEPDVQERWAVDYRTQARLTLKEFTAVLLQCVVYLNSARVLENLSPDQLQAEPTAVGLWQWCLQNGYSDMLAVSEEELRLLGLPRSEGRLTRTGLVFRGLRYLNFDYDDACFAAGKYGGKTVPLAYDEHSISQVFLISGQEFVPFELAPTHQRYGEMDFAEYVALRQKTARQKSRFKDNELHAKLILQKNIRKIVKKDKTKEDWK